MSGAGGERAPGMASYNLRYTVLWVSYHVNHLLVAISPHMAGTFARSCVLLKEIGSCACRPPEPAVRGEGKLTGFRLRAGFPEIPAC
jgi:hypothetical protein